jgi:hypothetical protein
MPRVPQWDFFLQKNSSCPFCSTSFSSSSSTSSTHFFLAIEHPLNFFQHRKLLDGNCFTLLFNIATWKFVGLLLARWVHLPQNFFFLLFLGWMHTTGGLKMFSHYIVFSKGVHFWTSTKVILEHIFSNFLHNMVDFNTKNSITKKIHFSNLYCEVPKYICGKKMYITMY